MPIGAWHAEALAGRGNGPTPRAPCRPPAREGRATAVAESKAGPSVDRGLTGTQLGGEEQGLPLRRPPLSARGPGSVWCSDP